MARKQVGVFKNEKRGVWEARIELPPGPNGERRRKIIRRKDHEELTVLRAEMLERLRKSGDLPTASMTVAQWNDYWMREIAIKTRRPKTIEGYRSNIKWIDQAIGNVRLDRVTPATVRKVHRLMANPPVTERNPDGKPLSSTYQRNTHFVMVASFGDAFTEGRMHSNPAERVEPPLRAVTILDVLTPDEAVKLITAFQGKPDAYLWAVYLLTGARRGEILGLEWDRVGDDLDLSWQLQRNKKGRPIPANFERRNVQGGLWWTRPKTKAGWRVIPLVDPLKTILESWRLIAPANEWGLVFTRPDENGRQIPIDPDYASRVWPEVRRAAGITKHVRLHDLRHTTVDLLLAAGVPEEVILDICGWTNRAMVTHYRSKANRQRVLEAMKQLSASIGY